MLDVYYLRKFPRIDKKTKRLVLVSDIGAVEFIQAFNANKGCWAALAAGAFWDWFEGVHCFLVLAVNLDYWASEEGVENLSRAAKLELVSRT
jgi:hypothetical protein